MVNEKVQRSAAVLSLWHCMLSIFLTNCEKERLNNKEYQKTMLKYYQNLKQLRLAIHNSPESDTSIGERIESLAKESLQVFGDVTREIWIQEVGLLMNEFKLMRDDVKEIRIKKYIGVTNAAPVHDMDTKSDLDPVSAVIEGSEARQLAGTLTIFYWLAAWSCDVPGVPDLKRTKDVFLQAIESSEGAKFLSEQIFVADAIPSNDVRKKQRFVDMLTKLHEMLSTEPEYWEQVGQRLMEMLLLPPSSWCTTTTRVRPVRLVTYGWFGSFAKAAVRAGAAAAAGEIIAEGLKKGWEAIKGPVEDLGNKIADGVSQLGDTINEGIDKLNNVETAIRVLSHT